MQASSSSGAKPSLAPVRDGTVLLTAAYLYYVEDLSQDEVARQIGVSRSTVSRLLAEARQTGVVRIEVAAPPASDALEHQLEQELELDRVYVAPGVADEADPGPVLAESVGKALLACELGVNDALLVSWGRATWSLSRCDLPSVPGVVVVPAVGGLDDDAPWFQPNEIARRLAASVHGKVRLLHAPSRPSDELRRSLLTDEAIRAVLAQWDEAAAIITGIGAWPKTHPKVPTTFTLDQESLQRAVGDVASRFFDGDGTAVESPTEDQLLGITRTQLQRIPSRIGVAVGISKADAILAAARSKLVNVLVTDVITASALLTRATGARGASSAEPAPR